MKKIKITVMRKARYDDLINKYESAPLSADWSEEINADYQRRDNKNNKI